MHKIRKGYEGFSFQSNFNGNPATSLGFQSSTNLRNFNLTPESALSLKSALQTFNLMPNQLPDQYKNSYLGRLDNQYQQFQEQSQNLIDNFIPKSENPDFSKGVVSNYSSDFKNGTINSNRVLAASVSAQSSNPEAKLFDTMSDIVKEDTTTDLNGNKRTVNEVDLSDYNSLNAYSSIGSAGDTAVKFGQTLGQSIGGKWGNALADTAKGVKTTINAAKNLKSLSSVAEGTKGLGTAKAGNVAAIAGAAADIGRNFLAEKTEYSGDKGAVTSTLDSVYDGVSDALMSIPGWGMLAGGIMKGGALLGQGLNNLGGGTDGMTTTDAILGSSFFSLTPFGLINGFGGQKSLTLTKDNMAFEKVGASYTGTGAIVDNAVTKAGKKYGAFSNNSRRKANTLIAEARRQQNMMTDIADTAQDRFAIRDAMSNILANNRSYKLQGGYQQGSIHSAKNGISIQTILKAKKIISGLKYGGKVEPYTLKEIPLDTVTPEFKEGGIIEVSLDSISEEYLEPYTLKEISLEEYIPEFKDGGSVNVIPEGALHARLHHMEDADNLTKKGIPVVSEKENGELEQQAEIEKDEIILRIEVTKQLEELQKKYYSDESSQKEKDECAIIAGKLLVDEILNNTIDNTGLLNSI